MRIRFACPHDAVIVDDVTTPPVCAVCGERRIQSVTENSGGPLRPPRFRGAVRGPCAVKESGHGG